MIDEESIMDVDEFKEKCRRIGLGITEETFPEGSIYHGENDKGERVTHRAEFGVSFDLNDYSLDNNEFDYNRLDFHNDKIVVKNVSGTRSSDGRGRVGFSDAELHFKSDGSEIVERH